MDDRRRRHHQRPALRFRGTEIGWPRPQVSFVTDGVDHALELAQEAAGDRMVSLSGADVAQQLLRAGKLDEIQVSVVPLLLGAGVRLFTTDVEARGLEGSLTYCRATLRQLGLDGSASG